MWRLRYTCDKSTAPKRILARNEITFVVQQLTMEIVLLLRRRNIDEVDFIAARSQLWDCRNSRWKSFSKCWPIDARAFRNDRRCAVTKSYMWSDRQYSVLLNRDIFLAGKNNVFVYVHGTVRWLLDRVNEINGEKRLQFQADSGIGLNQRHHRADNNSV